jgi:hypothetical protein
MMDWEKKKINKYVVRVSLTKYELWESWSSFPGNYPVKKNKVIPLKEIL